MRPHADNVHFVLGIVDLPDLVRVRQSLTKEPHNGFEDCHWVYRLLSVGRVERMLAGRGTQADSKALLDVDADVRSFRSQKLVLEESAEPCAMIRLLIAAVECFVSKHFQAQVCSHSNMCLLIISLASFRDALSTIFCVFDMSFVVRVGGIHLGFLGMCPRAGPH